MFIPICVAGINVFSNPDSATNKAPFPSATFKQPTEPNFSVDTYLAGGSTFKVKELEMFEVK